MARFGESTEVVKCSFCNKSQKQVGRLIAGPGVYICSECVALCDGIIAEEGLEDPEEGALAASALTDDQRRWREVQEVLAGQLGRRPTVAELAAELGWTDDRVAGAGRGVWVTGGTEPAGTGPGSLSGALRVVQRQLDDLGQSVAALAERAREIDNPE